MRPPELRWQAVERFVQTAHGALSILINRSLDLSPSEKEKWLDALAIAREEIETVVHSEECEMP